MMKQLEDRFFKALEALLVLLLAAMVIMVFGNVMMRWFFNDGIQISEEMSRYCFVWLTFIGAVVVMREHAHLGVDALVGALGPRGRLICMVLSDMLVLLCCVVFLGNLEAGTAECHQRGASVRAQHAGRVRGRLLHLGRDRRDGAAQARQSPDGSPPPRRTRHVRRPFLR
jgi:TRAP-type transport system small permease protein